MPKCSVFNFGFVGDIPWPQFVLSLDKRIPLVAGTNGMNMGNGCSIVIIDGEYLETVDEVMKKVDDITEEIEFMPYATFFMDDNVQINTNLRKVSV